MMIRELIKRCRTYRRFDQSHSISTATLKELVDLARMGASAANRQPLKYILCNSPQANAQVFATLQWAGYLADWDGPVAGERPAAYIIVLGDKQISDHFWCDHGIACQNILLGAVAQGLGGCIFGAVDRKRLRASFAIAEHYEILLVLALGKPKETVVLETARDGNIRYYRTADQVHHVPKRPLDEIILACK